LWIFVVFLIFAARTACCRKQRENDGRGPDGSTCAGAVFLFVLLFVRRERRGHGIIDI
jgi:hypothetical protein